jgi:hypothetical protein
MTEKKIDPKNPSTSATIEGDKTLTEDSRTSQRIAQKKVARVASKKLGRRII